MNIMPCIEITEIYIIKEVARVQSPQVFRATEGQPQLPNAQSRPIAQTIGVVVNPPTAHFGGGAVQKNNKIRVIKTYPNNTQLPLNNTLNQGYQQQQMPNQQQQHQQLNNQVQNNTLYLQQQPTQQQQIFQQHLQVVMPLLKQLRSISDQRKVDAQFRDFIGKISTVSEFITQYKGKNQEKMAKEFQCNNLKGFRGVRGDGNCFYTAFGYRLLEAMIFDHYQQSFTQLVNELEFKQLYLKNSTVLSNPNELQVLKYVFMNHLQGCKDREDLYKLFQYSEPKMFYECFIVFIKSLIYKICNDQKQQSSNDPESSSNFIILEEILIWEQELELTEVVIAALSEQLDINIIIQTLERHSYYPEELSRTKGTIILHFNPGHYGIWYQ